MDIHFDVKSLSDVDLEKIYNQAYNERKRRINQLLLSGLYLKLHNLEKWAIHNSIEEFIETIKSYRERTGCNLFFAKSVCEYERDGKVNEF